jgi:gliding motility-associated-like protein
MFITFFIINQGYAQLTVGTTMTAQQLVQNILVGTGVTVSNVTYSGDAEAIGNFTTGTAPTNLGISSGIIMSTGIVDGNGSFLGQPSIGSAASNQVSTNNGTGSDPDLAALIPGCSIFDAAVLEFDFIPLSDTIKFNYVFGSEEYPEFVSTGFNDVFGFFVTGPNPAGGNYTGKNIALIPGTNTPVSIDNVNNVTPSNPQYYIDNTNGTTIVYDGFTTVLTAWCKVIPCLTYHIKIAIGDAGDAVYDSGVFLQANSFSSNGIAVSDTYTTNLDTMAIEGCSEAIISFLLNYPATSPYTINYTIGGTATNGVDYPTIPNSITIPVGQDSAAVVISPILDNIPEGIETVILTVQTSVCGNTQVYTVYIRDNTTLVATAVGDTTICVGQATLLATGSGGFLGQGMNYTYLWSDNAVSTTSSIMVSPAANTTYYVTVTDACGATAVDSAIVLMGIGSANAGNDITICPGATATLVATGGVGATFLWSNNVTTAINHVSPLQTTTYYVTASIGPCDGYDSVTVFVNNSLNADFIVHPQVVSVFDPEVSFHDRTTGSSPPVSWLWNLGNGDTQNVPDFVYTYSDTGKFRVTLVVTDQNGCTDSAYNYVIVQPYSTIYFPNTFTPNGNGNNDVFKVFGTGIIAFDIKIYDRWGTMVYSSSDMNAGWDGKYEGRKAQQGVYTYSVDYKDALKKEHLVYGVVTLYR